MFRAIVLQCKTKAGVILGMKTWRLMHLNTCCYLLDVKNITLTANMFERVPRLFNLVLTDPGFATILSISQSVT